MIRETLEAFVISSSLPDMAGRLEIDMDDLCLRLSLLEERKFIQRVGGVPCASFCGRHCPGCALPSTTPAEGYELTEKGRRVLEK